MRERLVTFLVWALVGCSAGVLALRLWPAPPASAVPLVGGERLLAPSLDRLLGPSAPAPAAEQPQAAPADARFQLLGLVAARQAEQQGREGLALIAVDGGTPRSLRVGQALEGDLQLLRVEPTGVSLGRQGVVQVQLRLDPPAVAATGSLPSLSLVPGAPAGFPAGMGAAAQPMPQEAAPFVPPAHSGPMPPPGGNLPRRPNAI